jgi:hypothetical protein
VKVSRATQGSLWAETQKSDEASRAPEIDISELESLFSVTMPNMEAKRQRQHPSVATKQEKVLLIDLQRSKNCEIMLRNIKMPLPDLMGSVLALDDSIVDGDQVDYLIKFCPTKEEMELLKGYTGKKENLGNCEQVIFYFPRAILSSLSDEWYLANGWEKSAYLIIMGQEKSLFHT